MIQVLKMKRLNYSKISGRSLLTVGILAFGLLCQSMSAFAFPAGSKVYPLLGSKMSSDYGNRRHPIKRVIKHHDGIDLAAPLDAPIRSISDGVVIFADPYGGYGRYIVVRHLGGLTTHYGHCHNIKVRPGQRVKAGQILGTVGTTGLTTGPHLHIEIRINGVAQDPEKFLPDLASVAEG